MHYPEVPLVICGSEPMEPHDILLWIRATTLMVLRIRLASLCASASQPPTGKHRRKGIPRSVPSSFHDPAEIREHLDCTVVPHANCIATITAMKRNAGLVNWLFRTRKQEI